MSINGLGYVWHSADSGHSWVGSDREPASWVGVAADSLSITADPLLPHTVYDNLGILDAHYVPVPFAAVRSDDAGMTWTTIISPTTTPALQTFAIHTSPRLPGTLIGQTADKAIAPDVRYYSDDSGQTWTTGTCPGDLHGVCPDVTIGAAFGGGHSYAFLPGGIYSFVGRGAAETRLAIGDRLPVPAATITEAQAGPNPGDPVFILAAGQLYRGSEMGASWRLLTVVQGPTPNLLPPNMARGAVLVPQTRHAVGPAFAAAYKKLGLALAGYPVTEAYLENGTLSQDFQRLRLQVRGYGAVKEAPLGTALFALRARRTDRTGALYRRAGLPVAPVSTASGRRYFAATGHVLREPLLGYWQRHGGLAVFGPPISEVFRATNGDGSGRVYAMQYFANARLELHPESGDPHYAIALGLLGNDWLVARGWAFARGA